MRYDYPVYRPPSEAFSLIIQTTLGCPHNKCRFCFMYKDKRFKIRSVDDIKEDIISAKMSYGDSVRTIFLADGNSIIMKTPQLVEILDFCYAMFPNLERVTSYGAAKFVLGTKTTEELKELKKAGLTRIHMGLESGDDEVLLRIRKGSNSQEMIEASRTIKEAGMELSQYVLLGIAGKNDWERHAKNTAKVLSEMNPDFIRVRTLILRPPAPLFEDEKNGDFVPCEPEEVLNETATIIENLNATSQFASDHVSNYANINGKLPEEKNRMLLELANVRKRIRNDPDFKAWLEDPARCANL
ncbi:MAG: radical SAM protein [Thermoplasmata archaeon]|nr:MAG: radical SAM protein [Thermoplasmata archaeon]